jgi:hypothetical protein
VSSFVSTASPSVVASGEEGPAASTGGLEVLAPASLMLSDSSDGGDDIVDVCMDIAGVMWREEMGCIGALGNYCR